MTVYMYIYVPVVRPQVIYVADYLYSTHMVWLIWGIVTEILSTVKRLIIGDDLFGEIG